MHDNLKDILNQMSPISLTEMDEVKLLDRTDTKYVININSLPQIFNEIRDDYYILTIDNIRLFSYESLYFDTTDLNMFKSHHNGKLNRYKIRQREYVDSKLNFLEIKFKTNKGRTIKERIINEEFSKSLSAEAKDFILENTPFKPENLKEQIYTNFKRVTLVNKEKTERATVDIDITFKDKENKDSLPYISIIEVKQSRYNKHSKLLDTLKSNKILPSSFSKYCIGTVLLNSKIKSNRFKPKILKIKKLKHV